MPIIPKPTPQDAIDILKNADRLLGHPDNWTKGVSARFRNGTQCAPANANAAAWCAVGAVENAYYYHPAKITHQLDTMAGHHPTPATYYANQLLLAALPSPHQHISIAQYNDAPSTTYGDIRALFYRAIIAGGATPDPQARIAAAHHPYAVVARHNLRKASEEMEIASQSIQILLTDPPELAPEFQDEANRCAADLLAAADKAHRLAELLTTGDQQESADYAIDTDNLAEVVAHDQDARIP